MMMFLHYLSPHNSWKIATGPKIPRKLHGRDLNLDHWGLCPTPEPRHHPGSKSMSQAPYSIIISPMFAILAWGKKKIASVQSKKIWSVELERLSRMKINAVSSAAFSVLLLCAEPEGSDVHYWGCCSWSNSPACWNSFLSIAACQ